MYQDPNYGPDFLNAAFVDAASDEDLSALRDNVAKIVADRDPLNKCAFFFANDHTIKR